MKKTEHELLTDAIERALKSFTRMMGQSVPDGTEVEDALYDIQAVAAHLLEDDPKKSSPIDWGELRALRLIAERDKADLFDFYHKHWDEVVDRCRDLEDQVEKLEDDLVEMQEQRDMHD